MSNGYRAKWRDDSCREAEVEHFKRLKVAEKFLHFVVQEATVWAEEKEAAIKAGVEPVVALFGSRACGLDEAGNPLPEKTDKPAQASALSRAGLRAADGRAGDARGFAAA